MTRPSQQISIGLLNEYLRAPTDEEADRTLAELQRLIHPTLVQAFRSNFRVSMRGSDGRCHNQDALELAADAELSLISKLRSLREGDGEIPIENLEGYIRTITRNAYREYVRRRHPVRFSLKNQIRYVLTKKPGVFLRREEDGWVCGLIEFGAATHSDYTSSFPEKLDLDTLRSDSATSTLPGLVGAVLSAYGCAVPLERVVSDIFEFRGLREPIEVEGEEIGSVAPINGPQHILQTEQRELLEKLWVEIQRLPLMHRRALLLNLTNTGGESLIAELPLLRIASVASLARVLEMAPEELASIWSKLPLNDTELADLMGLTRQQVANLRYSARSTLKRRIER